MLRLLRPIIIGCLLFGLTTAGLSQKVVEQAKQKPDNFGSEILYGDNFAYGIKAPKGWVTDSETARTEGVSVVFYRRGETWQEGKATMYVNVVGREKGQMAKDVIADDIDTFKKRHPKMRVMQDKTLQTADNRKALTYLFKQINKNASNERVSYVETPTVILLITLTAKTSQSFKNAIADHTALVHSVAFIASKVKVERKQ